jgi:cobalamin-dependent methionine synthase I
MSAILDDAIARAKRLMELRTSHRILRVASNDGACVRFEGSDFIIESGMVAKLLRKARYAVCIAATAGIALDQAVSSAMDGGEITEAVMMDAVGSETVEAAVDELHWKILNRLAGENGLKVTPRFSPGYGDWVLTVQEKLVESSGGGRIGISVTPSSLMIPRKSVTAVLGFEPSPSV